MNKTAIKNFAIWARNKLRADIILKAGLLGITDKGIVEPSKQSTDDLQIFDIGTSQPVQLKGKTAVEQRKSLVAAIKAKQLKHAEAFDAVIEEVAYTWFNRLIAVRFMEVNDYLPGRVRVLSSDNPAKAEPDFVTNPFDTDLEFTEDEINLIDNLKDNNKSDELFQFLFIKQCNKLNEILPELFEKTNDYTELLLNVSFTDKDGVVYHLVHDISEDDFNIEKEGQVEIIGWLYQYYNTELNEQVYDGSFSKSKIPKELVPAATTIYTPDWAIRYMVENSLGRTVIHNLKYDCCPDEEKKKIDVLKEKWKYYLEEAEQSPEIVERFRMEESHKYNKGDVPPFVETTFLDPCMGSGHILVYAFDVFMEIYRMQGYTDREAVRSILENNLFGLEIDDRATQLAYFSIMMKARSYDRRFLTRKDENGKPDIPKLNICSIQESNSINPEYIELFEELQPIAEKLLDEFIDAKEYGSILNLSITKEEILQLEEKYVEIDNTEYDNFFDTAKQSGLRTVFAPMLKQAKLMAQKYDVVCTNPPYLGCSRFNSKLDKYVKDQFNDVKSDLSMVLYKKAIDSLTKKNVYISFITTSSWMFLSSFEKLRNYMQSNVTITSMMDLGSEFFEGKVGHNLIVSWVCKKSVLDYNMKAVRLVDYCYSRRDQKESEYFNPSNHIVSKQSNFSDIPGSPIAYWVSQRFIDNFKREKVSNTHFSGGRNKTHNNEKYTRFWWEISNTDKWKLYVKGGDFRRWYGNQEVVVDWSEKAKKDYDSHGGLYNQSFANKDGICWTLITSAKTAFRIKPASAHYDSGAPTIFNHAFTIDYELLGFLNSIVALQYLKVMNPTINMGNTYVLSLPYIHYEDSAFVKLLVQDCISISKCDWDSFENSCDFKIHPMIPKYADDLNYAYLISNFYNSWESSCEERFNKLKSNEEKLNRIFIDVYGLNDELTPEIENKDVTVRRADLKREIISLISYAVGCMFGRYSLDTEGLAYAGGEWDSEKYKTFIPDEDNCIPITDTAYFEDDIVGRFTEFVKVVYGKDTLEENLEFIAKALGNKGNTSRDIIRNYFLNDFFKDHCKIYQKRPIYWLFDSGKQNGFKALCYMHRWNADTIGNMRVEYLHRIQRTYEKEIEREQDTIDNTTNNRDKAAAIKRKEKLLKQLKEAKDYDAKVAHLALSRPDIDLDDGVKVNYEKVQTAQDGKKLQILAKI